MSENLPSKVLDRLKLPFGKLMSTENFGEITNHIAELIYQGQLTSKSVESLFRENNKRVIDKIKNETLDLILSYINLILDDNFISTEEAENVNFLKRFFKIKEGDFYLNKYHEIEIILDRQLEHMYQNDSIDSEEALQKVELQELFDLSYDQFLEISKKAVKAALDRGANPAELDTFINNNK